MATTPIRSPPTTDKQTLGPGDPITFALKRKLAQFRSAGAMRQPSAHAPVRPFKYSVWYYIGADSSVVVACLSERRDIALARRRRMRPVEPS